MYFFLGLEKLKSREKQNNIIIIILNGKQHHFQQEIVLDQPFKCENRALESLLGSVSRVHVYNCARANVFCNFGHRPKIIFNFCAQT